MPTPNAARIDDDIIHSSIWADIISIAAEAAVYTAAGIVVAAVATAAAPALAAAGAAVAGAATAIGGSCVVSGLIGGLIIRAGGWGDAISSACSDFANWLCPPSPEGKISTGSDNVETNGKKAARAAGRLLSQKEIDALPPDEEAQVDLVSSLLNMGKAFTSEMIQPTVDGPAGPVQESEKDQITCNKHSAIQYLAEGSDKVSINGLPAVRANDRSTCEGKVSEDVSKNVFIGGGSVVVRPIKSGKMPGLEFIYMAASLLRGNPKQILKKLPCMLAMGAVGMAVDRVGDAINAVFNPVHAATGAKTLFGEEDQDFILPARYPLVWQRIYNSRNPHHGLFGQGWMTPLEVSVVRETNYYCYRDMSGRELRFEPPVPGIQYYSADEGIIIAVNECGDLVIGDGDGECWRRFSPAADDPHHLQLKSLSDEYGNGLLLQYDEYQRLSTITDSAETFTAELLYSDKSSRSVQKIVERLQENETHTLVTYQYNLQGQVISVTDASGVVTRTFDYNQHSLLTQHRLPEGLICHYEWAEFDDWRVVEYRTNAGEHCVIDYDMDARVTHVTHANQYTHTHVWNVQFLVTDYTDESGNTWHYEWNDMGLLSRTVSPLNEQWCYFYNDFGCLTEETDPSGQTTLTKWLDSRDLIKSVTYPDGTRTVLSYDIHNGVIAEMDTSGYTTTFVRDEFGQVIHQIDAKQGINHMTYDSRGQLIRHQDCSGNSTYYRYNQRHQMMCTTDAEHEETHIEYDAAGRPLSVIRAEGWSNRFYWDELGRLTRHENADGTYHAYDWTDTGLLKRTINPEKGTVERHYDERGRLVALLNENQERYRFQWGPDSLVTDETGLDGVITHYDYDACGRAVQRTFAYGTEQALVHQAAYDVLGQLTKRTTADGVTLFGYNTTGQLISARTTTTGDNPYSQFVHMDYDKSGLLIREQTLSGRVDYTYDVLGNKTDVLFADGRTLKTLYYGSGHTLQINLDDAVITEFTRDHLHREVSRTQGHIVNRRQYDRLGRLSRQTCYHHTQQGTRPLNEMRWDYDLRHNLVAMQEETAPYGWKSYQYDNNEQLLNRRSDRYSPETYYYDAAANILDDAQSSACLHNRVTDYQGYHYEYDIFGRTTKKARFGEYWTYSYNSDHQLTGALHSSGNPGEKRCRVQFSYDPLGRRLHKMVDYLPALHTPEAYQRLPLNAHVCGTTTFLWEGLRLLSERRQGVEMLYVYEDNDSYSPLARIDHENGKKSVYYFRCQPNGLPDALDDSEGNPQWYARFTSWGKTEVESGRLHTPGHKYSQNLRFQGQYLDRETGLHYNTFRYYDPDTGRFTQHDPIGLMGGINLYQYAPNALVWVDPWGLSCSFDSKSKRWRNNETGRYTKRPTDPSELVRNGRVNKADIDAWANQGGIPNTWAADPGRFPSGGFKYEGSGYRVHGHGIDPVAQRRWPTSNSANGPTTSIKNTTTNQNYRTDGTWGTFGSNKDGAHIPLDGSGY